MKTYKTIFAVLVITFALSAIAMAQTPLTSLDGAKVDIQAQHGKVVILAIGASWLPLSRPPQSEPWSVCSSCLR